MSNFNMVPVSSSNIARVGYDDRGNTLRVDFLSGTTYDYFDVPPSVYEGLITAPSVGSYFRNNIRDGKYRYEKVK